MIKRANKIITGIVPNLKGGKGSIESKSFLTESEMHGKGRLFGRTLLKPGVSIGLHQHEGDCETYYILAGKGTFNDNGEISTVEAGDLMYTDNGQSHSIENTGTCDLEFIALIIYA